MNYFTTETSMNSTAHASSLDDLLEERERERESNVGYDPEMVTYRLSCPWSYTGARRLLAVLGLGLILVAIVSCCCSGILSDEAPSNEEGGTTKSEVCALSFVCGCM